MASENRKALNNENPNNRAQMGSDRAVVRADAVGQGGPGADEAASEFGAAAIAEDEYLKRETVRAMLSHVIDPEVGLDILTMGLIYDVDVSQPGVIRVEMTLTTKGCPMSAYITGAAKQAIRQVYPDDDIRLQLVWEPPWTPAMINRDGLDLLRR